MQKNLIPLDELEICIQLVQLYNPKLKTATYEELRQVIEKEFKQEVSLDQIFLLYEPTIEEAIIDSEIYFGSMFDYSKEIY